MIKLQHFAINDNNALTTQTTGLGVTKERSPAQNPDPHKYPTGSRQAKPDTRADKGSPPTARPRDKQEPA